MGGPVCRARRRKRDAAVLSALLLSPTLQEANLGWLRRVQGLNGVSISGVSISGVSINDVSVNDVCIKCIRGWDGVLSGEGAGVTQQDFSATFLFFLQVLLHPNSGAAGKDGEIETLRLAQYKAFYTTGTVSLVEIGKSGEKKTTNFWNFWFRADNR